MKNLGSASMQINLTDNKIKVFHGTSKDLLFQKEAKEKDWDNIWDAIEGKNKINKETKQIIKDLETYARVMNNNYLKHKINELKTQLKNNKQ